MSDIIYIVGSGAIGKALAVCLHHAQKKVVLIQGRVDDGTAFIQKLTLQLSDGSQLKAEIECGSLSNYPTLTGIILLTNKSFGNVGLAVKLIDKIGSSPVVLLQNGLGVERPFIEAGFPHLYRCVLFTTSQLLTESSIRYKPVTISPVGPIKGNEPDLNALVEKINSPLFPFRAEPNIQPVIWEKAIVNSVFNSICPLLDIDNGVFHREADVLALAKRIIKECVQVAAAAGVELSAAAVEDKLLTISKLSDGQFISTLVDINHKRETEIETLNFEIVRIAEQLTPETPVGETRLLGELTRLKARLSAQIG
ncbi:ketopantoate reductase family protein [Spirosoma endbachense]|uniref:2-dehydropantoate 2-reductase n=1 Tax=Spirosoma endbachense TaxID=2666025 RepID=A0A6P1VX99_9BACT|nr:2-dehydropantoate 2-reductase [Spirosoma endbachense]QHV96450.1 2-dehydropantoate 2-reductase [Spirosoma endbachense]